VIIKRSAVVLLAAAALAGCSGSPGSSPAPSGSTAASAPAVSATGPTGTGVIGTAPAFPKDAPAYATEAVAAWRQGDHARLAQLNDAADTVFATLDAGDYNKQFTLYRCDGAAGSSICTLYNAVGDTLTLRLVNERLGQAHAVVDGQWRPITFPTDLRAYAEEAVTDWSGRNAAAVSLLTGKPGDTAFAGVPAALRDTTWTFDHEEGAAGHRIELFVDPAGDSIGISFAAPGVAPTAANRHGLIETVYFTSHA
jgi:hypothetical protein